MASKTSYNSQGFEYYQEIWGFNPVTDRIPLKKGWSRFETFFPLENDSDFQAIGVVIGARVDWKDAQISNSIIFRCQGNEASVACTHAVLYRGQQEDILDKAEDPLSLPDTDSDLAPVQLPPEEHFVALKSYVAGIAEIGITQLFRASYFSSDYDPSTAVVGFNSLMQKQVAEALTTIAPVPARTFLQHFIIELMSHAPPSWVEPRLAYLEVTYNISTLLFHDEKTLTFAKEQFPALPWDKWGEIAKIRWNDLKEWAEWFSRIENIPSKSNPRFGLPVIGVDYPSFAKFIRETPADEIIDKFLIDPQFSEDCHKIFHVVIEEENWGGASPHYKRDLGFGTIQIIGTYVCLLFCLRTWGQNGLGILLGIASWFLFLFISLIWYRHFDKAKANTPEKK